METELANHLLRLCDVFAASRGLEQTTIGRICAGDSRFFSGIRDGQTSFTAKKYDKVVAEFAGRWPSDVSWPAGVPLPSSEQAA